MSNDAAVDLSKIDFYNQRSFDGWFYSLGGDSHTGVSRYMHFKEANIALNGAMKSNPMLSRMKINIPRSAATGKIIGHSPKGWVWHHHTSRGVMQLVPKSQHPNVPGGIFWKRCTQEELEVIQCGVK